MGKMGLLGEKPPHFKIWIDTFFGASEQLENQLVAITDRSVALLSLYHVCHERGGLRSEERLESSGWRGDQLASIAVQRGLAGDGVEQGVAEIAVIESLEENAHLFLFTLDVYAGNDNVVLITISGGKFVVGGTGQGEKIGL